MLYRDLEPPAWTSQPFYYNRLIYFSLSFSCCYRLSTIVVSYIVTTFSVIAVPPGLAIYYTTPSLPTSLSSTPCHHAEKHETRRTATRQAEREMR